MAKIFSMLASRPSSPRFNQPFLTFFGGKNVNIANVNQWRCLEENGQRLENADQTHLVLASGKLIVQKIGLICQKRIGLAKCEVELV